MTNPVCKLYQNYQMDSPTAEPPPAARIQFEVENRGRSRPETAINGWVYVARLDDLVKIGISTDPERRRRQLETGSGRKVSQFACFWIYAPGAAEKYLHERFAWCREQGEFFKGGPGLYRLVTQYLEPRQAKQR